jgi:hypothetical protein
LIEHQSISSLFAPVLGPAKGWPEDTPISSPA